jgi:hypothetical protein
MDGEDNPSSHPDGENTVLQLSALQKGGSTTLFLSVSPRSINL